MGTDRVRRVLRDKQPVAGLLNANPGPLARRPVDRQERLGDVGDRADPLGHSGPALPAGGNKKASGTAHGQLREKLSGFVDPSELYACQVPVTRRELGVRGVGVGVLEHGVDHG